MIFPYGSIESGAVTQTKLLVGLHCPTPTRDRMWQFSQLNQLKIAIMTWADFRQRDFSVLSMECNVAYARRYGYDVIVSSMPRTDVPATWQRIRFMQQYLEKYHYIVWIDADACFNPDDLKTQRSSGPEQPPK